MYYDNPLTLVVPQSASLASREQHNHNVGWRVGIQQSSILAQYILLLLTDYCTTGTCNPSDQRFAIEMGRQDIKEEQNISLYAVSKAMGFIPRNKLGHVFFR